jgi:rSAM/selenodomain-associated transferase 1
LPALSQTCAIAAMAKAPRVGEVKTRLAPPLSPEEAAALSAAFIQDIAGNILAAAEAVAIHGYVAYSPPGSEAAFVGLLPEGIRLLQPRQIGLGASLWHAAEDLLAGYGAACLVNADSPTLPTGFLIEAAQALQKPGDRVVLGPAEDGGYYLIALKRPHRRLFEDIAWSTERVFGQTLDRAAELGLETVILPRWYDVDDVESLDRLRREILGAGIPGAYGAPHTARLLRRFPAEPGAARTPPR